MTDLIAIVSGLSMLAAGIVFVDAAITQPLDYAQEVRSHRRMFEGVMCMIAAGIVFGCAMEKLL